MMLERVNRRSWREKFVSPEQGRLVSSYLKELKRVSLLVFFLLIQMVPGLVGVIYLERKLRVRSAHPGALRVTGEAVPSAR